MRAHIDRQSPTVAREVIAFGRCPRLGPLALSDDPLADSGLPVTISLAERCGTPYALRLPALDENPDDAIAGGMRPSVQQKCNSTSPPAPSRHRLRA
ncbi:MAG: hypothetical protein ACLFTI_09180 [Anaerolineales bacterium]